jgi:hypothetical protein
MSTLLGVFDDWQHAALLGGATIGGALVGIGILLETKRGSLAAILVLIGVIIEPIFTLWLFVYDENISRDQKTEIAELNRELAPRQLLSSELVVLKTAADRFPGQVISVWSYGLDLEGSRLARQILSAIREPTVDSVGHMVGSTTARIGVIVTGPDDELVEALLTALKPLSPTRGSLNNPGAYSKSGVDMLYGNPAIVPAEIFVGIKPLPK